MNKILLISIFVILTLTGANAQKNSILWEITGNEITTPSYLLGTLKFIGEKEYFLPEVVLEKIKGSSLFAIEDQIDHHAQHELNKALHFPKGESLATHLSAEEYKKVVAFFNSEFGISATQFEAKYARLKPLAISITMTRLSLKENVKFYDIELLKFAKQNKVKSFSLEHIEREAAALNSFTMDKQTQALLHSINNFEIQKAEFQKLMEDYPEGELQEIFEYTLHPLDNNTDFINEFYYKRNEEWLPKIEKMVKEGSAFISVGVAHLEGERGLLTLLKAKGYQLKAVAVK